MTKAKKKTSTKKKKKTTKRKLTEKGKAAIPKSTPDGMPRANGPRYKLSHESSPPLGKKVKRYLHTVYKEEYCDLLIEMMSRGCSYAAFLSEISVRPDTALYWYKNYPEFREAKDKAVLAGLRYWEQIGEAATRGELPGHSAQLYKFLIKNRYPQVYRDVQEIKKEVSIKFETSVNEQGQIEQSRTVQERQGIIDVSDHTVTKELGENLDE